MKACPNCRALHADDFGGMCPHCGRPMGEVRADSGVPSSGGHINDSLQAARFASAESDRVERDIRSSRSLDVQVPKDVFQSIRNLLET